MKGNSEITIRPIIGILGGVGPMAGILLHTKIINKTNVKRDQEHLDIVHLSLPQYIGDRTSYLLELQMTKNKEPTIKNPGIGMGKVAQALSATASSLNTNALVVVTCNTFHSPIIFNEFMKEIKRINMEICKQHKIKHQKMPSIKQSIPGYLYIHHMVELTLLFIKQELGINKVGLMSTTGTRNTHLYLEIAINKFNLEIIEIDQEYQDELHECIYNKQDGIKTLSFASSRVRANFEKYVKMLYAKGATAAILGCTEIPIVLHEKKLFGVVLIDPVDILANTLIDAVDCQE